MNQLQRQRLNALLAETERRQAEGPIKYVRCDDEGYPIDDAGRRTGEPKPDGPVFMLDMKKMSGDIE